MRFLILEGNERIIRIYQKFFDSKNYHVDFVSDSQTCFEKFSSEIYDYIILEQSTRILNMNLEDKIREKNPLQKILFLEPYMNLEKTQVSMETQYLVEKPFAMVTLLGKIELEKIQPLIKVK